MKTKTALHLLAALSLTVAAPLAFADPAYTIDTINPGGYTFANSLGADGTVYGGFLSFTNGTVDAFTTGANGIGFNDLGNFGNTSVQSIGGNTSGQIGIEVENTATPETLLVNSAGTVLQTFSQAAPSMGVGSQGQILALSQDGSSTTEILHSDGTVTAVTSSQGTVSEPGAMSASGTALVAVAAQGYAPTAALVSTSGNVTLLPTQANPSASAISRNGELVAVEQPSGDLSISTASGGFTDLGNVISSYGSQPLFLQAEAINDEGDVAGVAEDPTTQAYIPFLYANGAFEDLTTAFGNSLSSLFDGNQAHFAGMTDNGELLVASAYQAFLVTPSASSSGSSAVPEPAPLGLLGLAFAGLGLVRRKPRVTASAL